jgi:hypothetical protein
VRPSHRFARTCESTPPELQIGTENAHRDANLTRPDSSRRFQSSCRLPTNESCSLSSCLAKASCTLIITHRTVINDLGFGKKLRSNRAPRRRS